MTRREWRELGFFYDRDDEARQWEIVGSAGGVSAFCALLRAYARDSRRAVLAEHEHYGPYQYLKIMTSAEARLDRNAIAARPAELLRLAKLIESKVLGTAAGGGFVVGADWAPGSDYGLRITVAGDSFDPASADPYCQDSSAL